MLRITKFKFQRFKHSLVLLCGQDTANFFGIWEKFRNINKSADVKGI